MTKKAYQEQVAALAESLREATEKKWKSLQLVEQKAFTNRRMREEIARLQGLLNRSYDRLALVPFQYNEDDGLLTEIETYFAESALARSK